MFSPLQSLIDGSFLRFLDPGKIYDIYTDIDYSNREILSYTKVLSLDGLLAWEQKQSNNNATTTHIICITTKLTHRDILRIDAEDTRPKLWLSLHPGIMSIIHKYSNEEDDIPRMLSHGYTIREPYDQDTFIYLLHQTACYGRIIDTYIPEHIDSSTKKRSDSDYSIIHDHGHYHDTIILFGGSTIASVVQSISLVGDDHNTTLIAQWWWKASIDDASIVEHVRHASRIIIVVEHQATEAIWMYYDVLIKQYNPTIHISYIFPQYNLVTSILPEYIYELAGFDSEKIAEYIRSE